MVDIFPFTVIRPPFSLNTAPRPDTHVGANEDILYALSKDASSTEKFKRPMIRRTRLYARRGVLFRGYRTIGSFDKCPLRFWLAVNCQRCKRSRSSSNRPGHRSSGPAWQVSVFLVSVTLSRTSDGLDRTKRYAMEVPKSLCLRLRLNSPWGAPPFVSFKHSALFCGSTWRRSLIPPPAPIKTAEIGGHIPACVSPCRG